MIIAFLDYLDYGKYNPSRGAYGHPIPEFITGIFSYYLGTPFSNIICYLFFTKLLITFKNFYIRKCKHVKYII